MIEEVMDGVRVYKAQKINDLSMPGDTWQWVQQRAAQLRIYSMAAGSCSCHRHLGHDLSKIPERLCIARGKVQFTFLDKANGARKTVIVAVGDIVHIYPKIIHKLEILEDAVILESRQTHFNPAKPDTYQAEIN